MMVKKVLFFLFLLLVLFFFHNSAWALVAGDDLFGLDFRFNNPGARANAMGGAFIGLADDATAAYTNPAGLTILTKPEISMEFKYGEYTNRVFGTVGSSDFDDKAYGTSFISYAYPKEKSTTTLYRHRLVNIKSEYEITPGENTLDLGVVTTGLGMGIKLTNNFSFGLTVGFAQLEYFFLSDYFSPTTPGQPYSLIRVDSEDSAEHYSVALLWNPFGELNMGMVYRSGPKFITTKSRYSRNIDDELVLIWDDENTLKIPDAYGVGISYRFFSNLTTALDINYIEYSDLLDDLTFEPGFPYGASDFNIDNNIEVHLGLEYVIAVSETPFAIRCGYFYRPDHRLQYDGPDPFLRVLLKERDEDEHIFSLGFGTVFFENVQLDAAVSSSEFASEVCVSFVYRY